MKHREEKGVKKNEQSLTDCWDNIKQSTTCVIGIPEVEEIENGKEKIFEDILANLFSPNLLKNSSFLQRTQ